MRYLSVFQSPAMLQSLARLNVSSCRWCFLCLALALAGAGTAHADAQRVRLATTLGDIDICVYPDAAPLSAGSFLAHVTGGHFDNAGFYRVVRFDNDRGAPKINVIQGGLLSEVQVLSPVVHETTDDTGLVHEDGVVSLARAAPGTGSGSAFFVSIGDNPSLDVRGARNPDGQGFATFGRVISGMDVVRDIQAMRGDQPVEDAYVEGQILEKPVLFSASVEADTPDCVVVTR